MTGTEIPFQGIDAPMTSLTVTGTLNCDWTKQHWILWETLLAISLTLARRLASTMARGVLQNLATDLKVLYPAKFAALTDPQLDELAKLIICPLRAAKNARSRLHQEVLVNPLLGAFGTDVRAAVNKAKLGLHELVMCNGHRAAEGLLLRTLCRGFADLTAVHGEYTFKSPIRPLD